MEIDQRNSGGSVSFNNTTGYTVDRWFTQCVGGSGTGTATVQRVADAPAGFLYSLKWTTTNAKTPAASDTFTFIQSIEGQNIIDFAYGTASAKTVTFSFWVKSSLTGTFSGCLQSSNVTNYRSYIFNYTINSANTWQYVTITVPGDTGQVPYLDTNRGYGILFDMGSGSTYQTSTLNTWLTGPINRSTTSVNIISTLNATFQVTGVQLELGSVATPFERRSYGQELALCQRYYEVISYFPMGTTYRGNGDTRCYASFNVTKRVAPTMTGFPHAIQVISFSDLGSGINLNGSIDGANSSVNGFRGYAMGNYLNISNDSGGGNVFTWGDNSYRTVYASAEF
jgi:hypothetical protein